jgi:pyridoxal phosphate phosphatase PHOSPHO2
MMDRARAAAAEPYPCAQAPGSSLSTPRTLVVFDFDWSLIDENSDAWVIRKLVPDVAEHFHQYNSQVETWAQFMDRMMAIVHSRNIGRAEIEKSFTDIPLREAMIKAVELCKEQGCEIVIMSGANEEFIEIILKHYGIRHHFSAVHTHYGRWAVNGRLRVWPYHAVPGYQNPRKFADIHIQDDTEEADSGVVVIGEKHSCSYCSPDLCKGEILRKYLSKKIYSRVFYIGDSMNDLCPASCLSSDDHLLARKNYRLHKWLIQQKPHIKTSQQQSQSQLQSQSQSSIVATATTTAPFVVANVHLWESAEDVLAIFQQLLVAGQQV